MTEVAGSPEGTAEIRVLLVDDDALVRAGLSMMLNGAASLVIVGEAGDGDQVPAAVAKHRPDVVLMDLRMPRVDGITATRRLRGAPQPPEVIVLTTFGTDHDICAAIKAGAKAYMLKDAQREELLDCIRAVHAGETRIPPLLVAKLAAEVSGETLTNRELEVLALLARGRSNKNIALRLSISETTVKSHLRSVFNKLRVLSRTEAIAEASRRGLIRL